MVDNTLIWNRIRWLAIKARSRLTTMNASKRKDYIGAVEIKFYDFSWAPNGDLKDSPKKVVWVLNTHIYWNILNIVNNNSQQIAKQALYVITCWLNRSMLQHTRSRETEFCGCWMAEARRHRIVARTKDRMRDWIVAMRLATRLKLRVPCQCAIYVWISESKCFYCAFFKAYFEGLEGYFVVSLSTRSLSLIWYWIIENEYNKLIHFCSLHSLGLV